MGSQSVFRQQQYSVDTMKILSCTLALLGFCLAGEAPSFPQGALLVFPQQVNTSTSTTSTTTPAPQADDKENLKAFDASIMERLRHEVGAQQGVYHVYFPDGKLQRVQYVTAPVSSQQPSQGVQASSVKAADNQDDGSSFSVVPKAVYFVQVPADRLQNLQDPRALDNTNSTQQSNDTSDQEAQTPAPPAQYNQEQAPLSAQYLPITIVRADQLSNFRTTQTGTQEVRSTPNSRQGEEPAEDSSNQDQLLARKASSQPQGYLATLQFSQVQPISPPVYSYTPQSLVRILRYASA